MLFLDVPMGILQLMLSKDEVSMVVETFLNMFQRLGTRNALV